MADRPMKHNTAAQARAFAAAHVPGSSITSETIACRTVAYEPEIKEDAPHPQGYRPDLPIRSEREITDPYQRGFDAGKDEGYENGYAAAEAASARAAERETAQLQAQITTLTAALANAEEKLASRPAPRAVEG